MASLAAGRARSVGRNRQFRQSGRGLGPLGISTDSLDLARLPQSRQLRRRLCRREVVIQAPVKGFVGRREETFVGRRNELGVLRAALEQALSRRGRGVMIAGEPGIGKTRTAQEFSQHAAQQGASVLWGRCHEEAGAPPYWPWVQIIRSLLQSRAPEAPLGDLGPGAADIADLAPEMRDRLPGSGAGARLKDTAEARFRMFEAIRRLLAGACERQALVLVLDDLHWADAPSLRLLEFLAPEIADIPLMLVGTYRATELSRQHPLSNALGGLARAPHIARVDLPGLSVEEAQAFITAAAGTTPPAWFIRSLHQQTEGNPLFLREIVRFLEQQGILNAEIEAPDAALPRVIRVPEGLKEVIGRRLNLLSPACNEVLALASVIGRNFSLDVLMRAAQPLGADELIEALDEALAAHIINDAGAGRYQFIHNLVRVTLYDELSASVRRRMHRTVGTALEALGGGDRRTVLPELAHHFGAGGDLDRGIDFAVRAGQSADALLAFEDAAQFFQMALDTLALRADDDIARCRLLFQLGEAQRKSGEFTRAQTTLRDAAEAARDLNLPDLLANAALASERTSWCLGRPADAPPEGLLADALRLVPEAETKLRVELTGALARSLLYAGSEKEARERLHFAIAIARKSGDQALLARTLEYLFDFPWGPDGTRNLLALASESLEAAVLSGNTEVAFMARVRRVACFLELGDFEAVKDEIVHLSRDDARLRQRDYAIGLIGLRAAMALMLWGTRCSGASVGRGELTGVGDGHDPKSEPDGLHRRASLHFASRTGQAQRVGVGPDSLYAHHVGGVGLGTWARCPLCRTRSSGRGARRIRASGGARFQRFAARRTMGDVPRLPRRGVHGAQGRQSGGDAVSAVAALRRPRACAGRRLRVQRRQRTSSRDARRHHVQLAGFGTPFRGGPGDEHTDWRPPSARPYPP
jgi:tetratricopeptide (TPR) repeat protein